MKQIALIIIASILAINMPANENTVPEKFSAALEKYSTQYTTYKTIIKTDKDVYAPGEKVWFSANIINCLTAKRSNETSLTVILQAETGEIIADNQYITGNGFVANHISIPSWAPQGNIFIVAYTPNALEKTDGTLAAIKPLYVSQLRKNNYFIHIEPDKKIYSPNNEILFKILLQEITPGSRKEKVTVALYNSFQEIESITENIKVGEISNIKLKLPQNTRGGIYAKLFLNSEPNVSKTLHIPTTTDKITIDFFPEGGKLLSNNTQRIVYRASNPFGEPIDIEGKIYDQYNNQVGMAKTLKKGVGLISLMPMADYQYSLEIESEYGKNQKFDLPEVHKNGTIFTLMKTDENALKTTIINQGNVLGQNHSVIALSEGKIYMAFEYTAEEKNNFKISDQNLPYGIVNFMVLNEQGTIVSERLIYNKPPDKPEIKIDINESNNKISVESNLKEIIDERGLIQIEVKVAESNMINHQSEILNYDLLKYPLLTLPPKTVLDMFITNIELIANNYKYVDYSHIASQDGKNQINKNSISGKVHSKDGSPIADAKVVLNHPEKPTLLSTTSNQNGYFVFENITSHSNMSVKAVSQNGKQNYKVQIDHTFDGTIEQLQRKISMKREFPFEIDKVQKMYAQNSNLLKQIGSENREKRPDPESNATKLLKSGTSILDVIRVIKPYSIKDNQIVFYGATNSLLYQQGALIVIDGQKMGTNISALQNVNPFDVVSINISTNPVDIQHHTGLNTVGVIEIRTKGSQKPALSFVKEPQEEKEYHATFDPANFENKQWRYQNTLLWEPFATTSENGVLQFDIQKSEIEAMFDIIIDITTADGFTYRETASFSTINKN